MRPLYAYRIVEDHAVVVAVEVHAAQNEDARREIDHYAMQYAQDGPVAVQRRKGRRWETVYLLARRERVGLRALEAQQ